MLKLIPILQNHLLTSLFKTSFSTMRKIGKYTVPDLPAYKINPQAFRPTYPGQQQMSINQYNDLVGIYKKYRNLPQCRYFAFEYRNKIYHMFNAYHYPMGRMINQIATTIRGKNTPHYKNSVANVRNGEICVIVNAQDPLFTGKKLLFKDFKYHTGYIGNLRTFSYRAVLNKKPQLLYYYLLRKAMPKTKISEQYMKNVKIYRGPTHDIPNIPQFAPDRFIQNPLAQVDFQKYYKQNKDNFEIKFKGNQGKTGTVLGQILQQQLQKKSQNKLQTDNTFNFDRKTKLVSKFTTRQIKAFINIQKKIRRRYKTVRAPYNKKSEYDPGYKMYYSQKQAKKSPYYEELADQDMAEQDQEIIQDPLKRKGFDK